jgi:hypothetical protein
MWSRYILATLTLGFCVQTSALAAPGQLFGTANTLRYPAEFNRSGNMMIADQFNNRVIEINSRHEVVWSFGSGNPALCNPGPHTVIGPNDEERIGPFTLMAGTGVPPNTIPELPNGCVDNRVIAVNPGGHIVWQYGQAGVTGSGYNQLNVPVFDLFLPNDHILIVDQGNERVIEVTMAKNIVWQYGKTGVIGSGFDELNNPNSAELLPNGHILIADENNNRVIEVTRDHHIVWQYGNPHNTKILNFAAFASRLPNGNTLITDSGNSRVLEVSEDKNVVWSYVTNTRQGSISAPLPTRAVRLSAGDAGLTLISDQFNDQVIAVDHAKNIVFAQGKIAMHGNDFNQLYGPYDAKIIGDFFGLTPP